MLGSRSVVILVKLINPRTSTITIPTNTVYGFFTQNFDILSSPPVVSINPSILQMISAYCFILFLEKSRINEEFSLLISLINILYLSIYPICAILLITLTKFF